LRALIFFLFFTLAAGGGIARAESEAQKVQGGVAQSKKELGGIRKKLQEEKQRVKDIGKKESSVISQLNTLERNLSKKEKELKAFDRQLKAVTRKVQQANEDLQVLAQTIFTQESSLNERLVALYKYGEAGVPETLFSTRSPDEWLDLRRSMTAILDQDRRFLEDFRQRQNAVGTRREQLQGDERELQQLKEKTEKTKKEVEKDRAAKGKLLEAVRNEKKIHLAAVQDLEAASAQLQTLINRLEKEIRAKTRQEMATSPGKGFGALRGKLPRPVDGRVLSTFGKNENPQFHTFTVQKGIEIEAPLGAEIRAVYDGRVLYADWFKGYGKIVIIDHGEGYYTLSGHASALLKNVGEEVRADEPVALVGDTGSLRGPCLYFEIRQRGKPLDPIEWLAQTRAK
jgi:septal ring factor EnvC (AmiA/AmiB activator)